MSEKLYPINICVTKYDPNEKNKVIKERRRASDMTKEQIKSMIAKHKIPNATNGHCWPSKVWVRYEFSDGTNGWPWTKTESNKVKAYHVDAFDYYGEL